MLIIGLKNSRIVFLAKTPLLNFWQGNEKEGRKEGNVFYKTVFFHI